MDAHERSSSGTSSCIVSRIKGARTAWISSIVRGLASVDVVDLHEHDGSPSRIDSVAGLRAFRAGRRAADRSAKRARRWLSTFERVDVEGASANVSYGVTNTRR